MNLAGILPLLSVAGWLGLGDSAKTSRVVESAVVVIRTPQGGGSGFLAELDGNKYIVTNQHVLMGTAASDVRITFIDGTEAHPINPEIVGDLDLARLEFATERPALKIATGDPAIGARVVAVGNSLDAGVLTMGEGRIRGVGGKEIEVDCDFVPGNSGGPIVDTGQAVLGAATYIRIGEMNAATADTRYVKNRRFAVRLREGMAWTPIPQWAAYAAAGAMIRDAQALGEEVLIAAQAIASNQDLALFKPKAPKVTAAIGDFERLRKQFARLSANGLTARELQGSRTTLTATYRSAFQKLYDACAGALRDMNGRPIPPAWGWLNNERKTTSERLRMIQTVLAAEIKKEPPF